MIGRTLGHYQITSQLGKGGMGEVYRARDTMLNRDVALKVLPPEFANDHERMARFRREAQLLASLNHTSIAAIHGLEECDGVHALILELAEGPTLADRISKGPIQLDEALSIARQTAEALEAAHEKGIIHRDLKPANIKVTPEGSVKVLDFGLAKALEGEAAVANASESPTLSLAATKAGVILGTAAYMAPEQARGSAVDKRCDVWSFGVVLFEMLTGKQLFAGETVSDTLAAVLRSDVDLNMLPANIPGSIRTLLRRCLTKDRKERLRDIGDARIAIAEHLANPAGASVREMESIGGSRKRFERITWSSAVVLLVAALAALGIFYFRKSFVEAPAMRLEVNVPPTWDPVSFAISPDGRQMVFAASSAGKEGLWLRPLDQVTVRPLAGTEGAKYPFWSPDSQRIGFFAGGQLKRIDAAGGPPQAIASAPNGVGGTWSKDGIIVFARAWAAPLYRVPASGGEPVPITRLDPPRQIAHVFPRFLPDGRHLVFFAWGEHPGVYLGALDSAEAKRLIEADTTAAYAPPGYLLFMRQGTLFAQLFNAERMEVAGDEVRIADSVAFERVVLAGGFSVSDTGILAYRAAGNANRRRLAWFDRSGNEVGTLGTVDENNLSNPEISPDGHMVAVDRTVQQNRDIYLMDTAQGVPGRFTFDNAEDAFPLWSPDGSRIVFGSNRNGNVFNFYQKASSGAADEKLILESPLSKWLLDCSRDGQFLLYVQWDPNTGGDLWVLPLFGDRKPYAFLNTTSREMYGQFSPDGRWVAYQSNEAGMDQVYIQSFPGPGGRRQVSTDGGYAPRWRRDGSELFFISPDGKLMAAPIQKTGQTPKIGLPVALFQTRITGSYVFERHPYAVAPDGQRFLMNITADESTASPITIVTNWARALKK